jgi:hypothetical protein
MDFPKRFTSFGSELSSIVRIANAVAAWLDIHLRKFRGQAELATLTAAGNGKVTAPSVVDP